MGGKAPDKVALPRTRLLERCQRHTHEFAECAVGALARRRHGDDFEPLGKRGEGDSHKLRREVVLVGYGEKQRGGVVLQGA